MTRLYAACREVLPSPSEYGKMGWFYVLKAVQLVKLISLGW